MLNRIIFIVFAGLLISSGSALAQQQVVVRDLMNNINRYLDNTVVIEGVVDRHVSDSRDLGNYFLRDIFGDEILVRTVLSKPVVNNSFRVVGTFEEGPPVGNRRTFYVRELERRQIGTPEPVTDRLVVINSVPSGAKVWYNDRIVGETPYQSRFRPGSYTFSIEKPFYEAQSLQINVSGSDVNQTVNLNRSALFYILIGLGVIILILIVSIGFIIKKKIDEKRRLREEEQRRESQYADLLNSGENAIQTRDYDYAISLFQQASGMFPERMLPKERINYVKKLKNDEKDKNKIEPTPPTPPSAPSPPPGPFQVSEDKTIKTFIPTDKTIKIIGGKFKIISGYDTMKELSLYADPNKPSNEYTFGRNSGQDYYHFRLKSPTVSRKHAKLLVTKNNYVMMNYSRTNPTTINGSPMEENETKELFNGDVIEIGDVKLEFIINS